MLHEQSEKNSVILLRCKFTFRASRFRCPLDSALPAASSIIFAARLCRLSVRFAIEFSCVTLARLERTLDPLLFFADFEDFESSTPAISTSSSCAALNSAAVKAPTDLWVPICLFCRGIFPIVPTAAVAKQTVFRKSSRATTVVQPVTHDIEITT